MKKLLTLILLFTITLFLSANQIVIANDYNFIISNREGFDFTDGTLLNDAKYQRTNKIAITNETVIADRLKYHYVFFWNEADAFLGYYKTSKAPITSGTFLGQVNTNNIPLPLNAYSFALVRYDNDYELVAGLTIKDIFLDSDNYFDNTIIWSSLNNLTLNEVFEDNNQIDNFELNFPQAGLFAPYYGNIKVWDFGRLVNFLGSRWIQGGWSDNPNRHSKIRIDANINDKYYINAVVYGFTEFRNATINDTTATIIATRNTASIGNLSAIRTATATGFNYTSIQSFYQSFNTNHYFKDIYGINLTPLGIDTLTTTNLNNFYFLYQNVDNDNFNYVGYSTIFINPTYAYDEKLLNLTAIFGLGSETDEPTINGYYAAYEEYLDYTHILPLAFTSISIQFQTTFFNDGVSEQIETLGLILTFTLIAFTLMIFGFISNRRIFNLLSIGAFVVLGVFLIEFIGFIIILFGLIFINVYYTFFGEL